MKKVATQYTFENKKRTRSFTVTVDEETPQQMSLHEYSEPVSGVLKHWGTKQELIDTLEEYIVMLKQVPTNEKA